MSNEHFDDGLVHSHAAWCSERGAASHEADRAPITDVMAATPDQLEHDDGLVHDHGWACSERGRFDPTG